MDTGPFRPPRAVILGSGKTRWSVGVEILRLSEFEARYREHVPPDKVAPLPFGLWCDCCLKIRLRMDRARVPGFRLDFIHELDHAFIDWRGTFFEG